MALTPVEAFRISCMDIQLATISDTAEIGIEGISRSRADDVMPTSSIKRVLVNPKHIIQSQFMNMFSSCKAFNHKRLERGGRKIRLFDHSCFSR